MGANQSLIRKAVFPVAGMGTRFLPATKASPKEMLPVVNKPLIQYAVEEAYSAGIRQMIFVICHNKNSIEDHFDSTYQFESELLAQDKEHLLAIVAAVTPSDMECFYVRQPKAYGLGHAVLCTEHIIGNEPFACLLADDLMLGPRPIIQQMMDCYETYGCSIIAAQDVPQHMTNQYGIISGKPLNDMILAIDSLIEKPPLEAALSETAVVGRYILTPLIFDSIKALSQKKGEEIQLTDAIAHLLNYESVYAYRYEGVRYDCGSVAGFLKANVVLGREHPTEGAAFSSWLQSIIKA
jgi:UTP--glucose-1-phosphate uridylyltransferase